MFSEAVRYFDLFGLPRNMLPNNKTAQFLLSVLNYLKKLVHLLAGRCVRAVDDVASSADPWIEAPLERGQVQYLNNHELSHYRSEFEDGDDPATKRHFYRLWHRSEGGVNYDG